MKCSKEKEKHSLELLLILKVFNHLTQGIIFLFLLRGKIAKLNVK